MVNTISPYYTKRNPYQLEIAHNYTGQWHEYWVSCQRHQHLLTMHFLLLTFSLQFDGNCCASWSPWPSVASFGSSSGRSTPCDTTTIFLPLWCALISIRLRKRLIRVTTPMCACLYQGRAPYALRQKRMARYLHQVSSYHCLSKSVLYIHDRLPFTGDNMCRSSNNIKYRQKSWRKSWCIYLRTAKILLNALSLLMFAIPLLSQYWHKVWVTCEEYNHYSKSESCVWRAYRSHSGSGTSSGEEHHVVLSPLPRSGWMSLRLYHDNGSQPSSCRCLSKWAYLQTGQHRA